MRCKDFLTIVTSLLSVFNCTKIVDPNSQYLITYNFTAIVDLDKQFNPDAFNVTLGDTLSGTFCYLSNSHDNNDQDSNQGWYYHLPPPAKISFKLDSLQYSSDLNFIIQIQNNDTQIITKGDLFELSSFDTAAANRFRVDNINEILMLQDTTSNVFHSDSLPLDLNLRIIQ